MKPIKVLLFGSYLPYCMPQELTSIDEITESLLERTFEVYRKTSPGGMLKYKLRTKKYLYTLKVEQASAGKVEGRISESNHPIEIIDV